MKELRKSKPELSEINRKSIEQLIRKTRNNMRDWQLVEQRLDQVKGNMDLELLVCAARRYLNDEITSESELKNALKATSTENKKPDDKKPDDKRWDDKRWDHKNRDDKKREDQSKSDENLNEVDNDAIVAEIRSLFPPPVKETPRQRALNDELEPLLRDVHANKWETIRIAAWRYSVLDDYGRRDLENDLPDHDAQNFEDRIHDVVHNYWLPRHSSVINEWERLFAEQKVLELPNPQTAQSRQDFAKGAVANERMSILQRLRFFASFGFQWGISPLVEEEGSGVEHNPLHRIWSVRQRRRGIETKIVNRLNSQILASPDFVANLFWSDARFPTESNSETTKPVECDVKKSAAATAKKPVESSAKKSTDGNWRTT